VGAAGEPADVADIAEQAGGAGGADAVQIQQPAAGGLNELGQLLVRDLDLLVGGDKFVDQLGGQPAAGLADHIAGSAGVEQGAGLLRGQELLGAAGHEFQQEVVQPADDLGAGPAELVAGSTSSRNATVVSSTATCRRPGVRNATTATLRASTGSILRPWPVAKTRARADSFAGTSTTVSPSATRRWATWRPMPLHPSTAQRRSACLRPAANMAL
jgi:hypothetical protein